MLDRVFGEPRNALHPVAWFGRALTPVGHRLRGWPPAPAAVGGALAWTLAVGAVAALAGLLQQLLLAAPALLAVPALALLVKPGFAWRMLRDEVQAVDAALAGDLAAGRARLARLCSRDVQALDATGVRETAIESLAENLNDSVVAPLFWFAVAGLPGLWAWRAANTLDAMWGYRGRWEWAGKWAARADDLLGWLPARLSAALLWRPGLPPRALRREAARTPSPNGGWPMAAMALRLGLRLRKPGVYTLHAAGREADAGSIAQAVALARRAVVGAFALAAAALWALDGPLLVWRDGA